MRRSKGDGAGVAFESGDGIVLSAKDGAGVAEDVDSKKWLEVSGHLYDEGLAVFGLC